MEIINTIFQDLASFVKEKFFKIAMRQFLNFCLGKFMSILKWIKFKCLIKYRTFSVCSFS